MSKDKIWWRYSLELLGDNVRRFPVKSMFQKVGYYVIDNEEATYRNWTKNRRPKTYKIVSAKKTGRHVDNTK